MKKFIMQKLIPKKNILLPCRKRHMLLKYTKKMHMPMDLILVSSIKFLNF